MITIIWFQRDLRIQDNPALKYASKLSLPILPIYILDSEEIIGSSSRWWLHYSLQALQKSLRKLSLDLFFFQGRSVDVLQKVIDETDAKHIVWNCCYEPSAIIREKKIIKLALAKNCIAKRFHANLLFAPGQITTKQGNPYQVFTPFWRCCLKQAALKPEGKMIKELDLASYSKHIPLKKLDLLPHIPWDLAFPWQPGEGVALKKWNHFLKTKVNQYARSRDFPAEGGTSMLSPHLHFGEISVKRIFEDAHAEVFLREIGWREFAYHLLITFPHTVSKPLREEFLHFPWIKNTKWLKAWQKGMTGIPIVDAGMRQLWQLGWMHNRVRMIVASFLVKDLMISWQEGASWFWDTLVDADLANNTLGWQWSAGCGADAAPYFRIFNPFTQGKKFDPNAEYVRRFVPELKNLPNQFIHTPHLAPSPVLEKAGVYLGKNYPYPIVDHDLARKKALQLYYQWSKKRHGHKN